MGKWQQKTAAKRIGVTLTEYMARLDAGEKWCTDCKAWHDRDLFPTDKSRGDGLAASCRGRAIRIPRMPLTDDERRAKANAAYRRYYAGSGGSSIRARVYARKRKLDPIPEWWREDQLSRGCAYCGAPATTLDHFIPVRRGGKSKPTNLLPACGSCNSKKKASDPLHWIDKRVEAR